MDIRAFLIVVLIFSGFSGNYYIQYFQNVAMVNIVEEETEHQKNEKEKKEIKEYIKNDFRFRFLASELKKIHFLYLADWNSLIIDVTSPPPENTPILSFK